LCPLQFQSSAIIQITNVNVNVHSAARSLCDSWARLVRRREHSGRRLHLAFPRRRRRDLMKALLEILSCSLELLMPSTIEQTTGRHPDSVRVTSRMVHSSSLTPCTDCHGAPVCRSYRKRIVDWADTRPESPDTPCAGTHGFHQTSRNDKAKSITAIMEYYILLTDRFTTLKMAKLMCISKVNSDTQRPSGQQYRSSY